MAETRGARIAPLMEPAIGGLLRRRGMHRPVGEVGEWQGVVAIDPLERNAGLPGDRFDEARLVCGRIADLPTDGAHQEVSAVAMELLRDDCCECSKRWRIQTAAGQHRRATGAGETASHALYEPLGKRLDVLFPTGVVDPQVQTRAR